MLGIWYQGEQVMDAAIAYRDRSGAAVMVEVAQPILEQHRLAAAVHIANTVIRTNDAHAITRLMDVIQSSRAPNVFRDCLTHRLGRERSGKVGLVV